jgi:hypothetical protein
MVKISPQHRTKVSLLEVADLEEAEVEEETHEEEEEARMADDGMKEHQINGAEFVTVTLMTRRTVGTKANRNATIARDSGTFKRIAVLQISNMLRTQKENLMKEICFLLVKKHFMKKVKMFGIWTAVVATI